MTAQQMFLTIGAYAIVLTAVVYFTRPTSHRFIGALAGGATAGLVALGMIAMCQGLGWWDIPSSATPYFWLLVYLAFAVSMSPIYLITWRVARRFVWRGLAVCLAVATVVGPPRDYLIAAKFPEWMVFAPGLAPILADAATYFGMVALGHAMMRLVGGPAQADRLARL